MARPTKYSKALDGKAATYLKTYKTLDEVVPTIEGLSVFLNVTRRTIYHWCEAQEGQDRPVASDTFLHTVEMLSSKQGLALQTGALSGDLNSTIAKLMLSANHDMREKSDVTTKGKEIPTPLLPLDK